MRVQCLAQDHNTCSSYASQGFTSENPNHSDPEYSFFVFQLDGSESEPINSEWIEHIVYSMCCIY